MPVRNETLAIIQYSANVHNTNAHTNSLPPSHVRLTLFTFNRFGNTALHYTAMSGNVELVKLLVTYHTKYRLTLNKTNKLSRTARDEAIRCGNPSCAAMLDDVTSAAKDDPPARVRSTTPLSVEINIIVEDEDKAGRTPSGFGFGDDEGGLAPRCLPENQNLDSRRSSKSSSERSSVSKVAASDISQLSQRRGEAVRGALSTAVRSRPSSAGSDASSRRGTPYPRKQALLHQRNSNSGNENCNKSDDGSVEDVVEVSELRRPSVIAPTRGLKENTSLLNSFPDTAGPSITAAPPTKNSYLRRESTFVRRTSSQLLPYEKDQAKIIRVASENDFRNSREYVLKLARMEFSPAHFLNGDCLPGPVSVAPVSAGGGQCEEESCKKVKCS